MFYYYYFFLPPLGWASRQVSSRGCIGTCISPEVACRPESSTTLNFRASACCCAQHMPTAACSTVRGASGGVCLCVCGDNFSVSSCFPGGSDGAANQQVDRSLNRGIQLPGWGKRWFIVCGAPSTHNFQAACSAFTSTFPSP